MFKKTAYELRLPGETFSERGNYYGFSWTYCNAPENGVITWPHGFRHCRDGGISDMRGAINSGKLKTDCARFLFRVNVSSVTKDKFKSGLSSAEDQAARALSVMNVLEKMAGWRLTRAYKLKTPKDYIVAYYFLGSRRWIKSSYLAYLYVMLFRMCQSPCWGTHKNWAEMKNDMMSRISRDKVESVDAFFIKRTFPYWEALLRGYPELFEKKKLDYYWSPDRLEGKNGYGEGIDTLCSGHSSFEGLYRKLTELKKQFDQGGKK